jgi:hypothetical protein
MSGYIERKSIAGLSRYILSGYIRMRGADRLDHTPFGGVPIEPPVKRRCIELRIRWSAPGNFPGA